MMMIFTDLKDHNNPFPIAIGTLVFLFFISGSIYTVI